MKRIWLALLVLTALLLPAGAVLASDVTSSLYKVVVTIGNVGTDATNVATVVGIKSPNLIAGGYSNAGVTNIALRDSTGADVPFMPGNGANDMVLYVADIEEDNYQQNLLYLAESTGGEIVWFPGATGLTVTDNLSLEPGNTAWSWTFAGTFIGANSGAARYLLYKGAVSALNVYWSLGVDDQLNANINNGALALQIDGVDGKAVVVLSSTGGGGAITLAAYDGAGVLIDSDTGVSPAAITNNVDDWVLCDNDNVIYCEYISYSLAGAPMCYWDWEYGATFTDNVSSVVATPTFRTTTSDADVTATASAFTIITPAEATGSALGSPSDWYTTPTISGTFSTGTVTPTFPGAEIITAIADASSTPVSLPFTIIGGVIILIISLSLSRLLRIGGSGSLIVKSVIIAGLMGVLVATQIWDLWMVIVFVVYAAAISMASQQRGWGS